ncbi:MAG TPA: peptidylprolyl isomerase, partial [Tepidisphaeraceae bacterium]|nr:peptidylprolyl isomerase [Tepidisphaeraceae bacterium]
HLAVAGCSMIIGTGLLAQVQPAGDKPAPAAPAQPPQPQVDPAKIVLTVGENKMTAGDFNEFVAQLPPEVQMMAKGPQKRRVAEDLVKLKLLAGEAAKKGMDQTPKFKKQMELMRENALAGAFFNEVLPTLVSDADVKKYYDEHKNQFERATARHILVPIGGEKNYTDDQARTRADEIKKRLEAKPDDFAAVAKMESADPGSKDDGGDLPPFPRGQMVKEFDEAAFTLPIDQIGAPVKTRYGYHLIQVKKREIPALDDVKEDITEQLRPQRLEALIEDLKKKNPTNLDEAFFGPPPPQGAQPPAGGQPVPKPAGTPIER